MKDTKKYRPILIILFLLALCLVRAAGARADEPACPEGWQEFVWAADDGEFCDTKDDDCTITYTDDGLLIDVLYEDFTLSYAFEIPEKGRNYLRWHANLQVRNVTGGDTPGISFKNNSIDISFCVDRRRSLGSLRFSDWGSSGTTRTIAEFDLPKFNYPCTIGLRYDAVTHELTAFLNDAAVKKVKLPYYGIPAIVNIRKIGIETTTSPHTSIGNALYGDLTLWAQ